MGLLPTGLLSIVSAMTRSSERINVAPSLMGSFIGPVHPFIGWGLGNTGLLGEARITRRGYIP